MTTTIAERIEHAHYVATEAQIEALALEHYGADHAATRGRSTYLRTLIAGCQAKLGRPRRGPKPGVSVQSTVLESIHETYYAAVLRGVTTPEIAADESTDAPEQRRRGAERDRRATFARTAAATLRAYVRARGDLRALDVATATKSALRAAMAPPESSDREERITGRAEQALLRSIERQAKADPESAREHLEAVIERLQAAVDELPATPVRRRQARRPKGRADRGTARTRVGVPLLHHPTAH